MNTPSNSIVLEWHGSERWWHNDVYSDCYCDITIHLIAKDNHTTKKTTKTTNVPKPNSHKTQCLLKEEISDILTEDFYDYVNCDDYYPPVAEDYDCNAKFLIEKYCEKNGLKIINFNFKGKTEDFVSF